MRSVRLPLAFNQLVRHSSLNFPLIVIGLHLDAEDQWTAHLTDPIGGGHWIFPVLELEADFHDQQDRTAAWLGYLTVEEMNEDHDTLHMVLATCADHESLSMAVAEGQAVTVQELTVANLEEEAVLHLQRYLKAIDAVDRVKARGPGLARRSSSAKPPAPKDPPAEG